MKPKLRFVVTEFDRETWKEFRPIQLIRDQPLEPVHSLTWLLSITVWNRSRELAQGCRVVLSFVKPFSLKRFLQRLFLTYPPEAHYTLGWMKEFDQMKVKGDRLPQAASSFFERQIDIQPQFRANLCVLFTLASTNEAYLTSEKLVSIVMPSKFDVLITVVGLNFSAKEPERYRITLRSKDNICISKVTWLTLFFDLLRNLKKWIA